MNPDKAVFSPAGITLSIRVISEGVDGTEVALHPREFLLEDSVEESRIELADARCGRRDVHRLLPTAEHHIRMLVDERTDGGRVDWPVRLIGLERLECGNVPEARRRVFARTDEHRPVVRELHVVNLFRVLQRDVCLQRETQHFYKVLTTQPRAYYKKLAL